MSWEEELKGLTLGTLFKLGGKCMLASILWVVLFYIIIFIVILLPMLAITSAITFFG